ncbi:cation:proton antiporter [Streptomyces sp. NPDC057445]|uniref:cation:proton antiporter domain-containing protein n=1 Tax=Streptomyces sp. NPDC057445 TaxID=3346136 RepID=UPI0036AD080F
MSGGAAWTGVAVAAVTAGYALVSKRLAVSAVTAAMVFTGCGVLIGPAGLDILDLQRDAGPILVLVEAALTLVLFTDAIELRGRDLQRGRILAARLVTIGLLLTIAGGWLLAWLLLPSLTLWEAALVAAILAPTEIAVCRAAVANRRVPALVRHGLTVETGINDGLVLPFFLLFLAAVHGTTSSEQGLVGIFWRALVLSAALGLAVGGGCGWLLHRARTADWVGREWSQAMVLAVALASYALAAAIGGSGFVSAWAAGFAFAAMLRRGRGKPLGGVSEGSHGAGVPVGFAESIASLLAAISFLVFGAVMLGPALQHLDWQVAVYAMLSVAVVRPVSAALALMGSGLRLPTVAYTAWFGPRGLPSLVLGLLAAEEHVPGARTLLQVVAVTVALSVLLHGVSAVRLSELYAAWHEKAAKRDPRLREGPVHGSSATGDG